MQNAKGYILNNIMEALRTGPKSPGAIVKLTPHEWKTVRKYLLEMEANGVVTQKVNFREYEFELTKKGEELSL